MSKLLLKPKENVLCLKTNIGRFRFGWVKYLRDIKNIISSLNQIFRLVHQNKAYKSTEFH